MKTGLESLVKQVRQAIHETASSPQMQQARREAVEAGQQAVHEARPHVLDALRAVNRELQTLIQRLESPGRAASADGPETGGKEY